MNLHGVFAVRMLEDMIMSRLASMEQEASDSPSSRQRSLWLLALFCLCVWLPGFATMMPTDRDESRFAQASKQMIETGDYVRIMNGAEARNNKPIGVYWAQVPFVRAAKYFGLAEENPIWPYRLPSLLGALLAVMAVAVGGERIVGRRVALRAAFWFASSLLLVAEAHIAKTDAALAGVTTVAMLLLGRAFVAPETVSKAQAAGFWVAVAAGILLKGPICPMIAGLTVVSLGLWTKNWAWLRALRPASGLLLLLLLVLPWFVAIGIATKGAFFVQSLGGDLAGKIVGSDDAHGHPFGTYLALLPLVAFPVALPVLRAFPAVWRSRQPDGMKFLIAWLVPGWLVFEIVHTKLPHYVLPLYPALFLLAASVVNVPVALWWRRVAVALSLLGGAGLAVGVMIAPSLLHQDWWVGLPTGLAILTVAVLAAQGRQTCALMMMPLVMLALLEYELPRLPVLAVSPRLQARLVADGLAERKFAAAGYGEPSLMFLAGTDAQWWPDGNALATWLIQNPGAVALVESRALPAFHAADPAAIRVDEVDGFDYSNGKRVSIGIYR
jgi:4-amino-4-deoxy-L-arabinose transferase-like glycosyltransferase